VALLTDDVFTSMPPMALEYEGRDAVAGFCRAVFAAGRPFEAVPTRANGQPALGLYLASRGRDAARDRPDRAGLSGDRIRSMVRFESGVLPWFGLPRTMPGS